MSLTEYRAPVIEYCGGTEIGGGHLTGTVVQPASPATFSTPALGLDLVILDEGGQPVGDNAEGEVFLVPPSIGLSQTLLNRDHDAVYYEDCPGGPDDEVLRRHGDQVARLPGGYFRAQGRADDTMNLGGIKVSSLELERVLEHHAAVFEAAAVAVQPEGEGAEKLVLFVVLSGTTDRDLLAPGTRQDGCKGAQPALQDPRSGDRRIAPQNGLQQAHAAVPAIPIRRSRYREARRSRRTQSFSFEFITLRRERCEFEDCQDCDGKNSPVTSL